MLIAASIALLAGLTLAWFTDTVANKGNKIQAGTLNVQLWDGDAEITSSSDPVFDYANWEPGYADTANLKVVNAGSLALKYELRFRFGDMSASKGIENVIDVEVGGTPVGALSDFIANSEKAFDSGVLKAGESSIQKTVTLKMQETGGNAYQGQDAVVNFDILLVATQAPVEQDGFGSSQYDKDAVFPWDGITVTPVAPDENGVYGVSDASQLAWISQEVAQGMLARTRATDGVVIELREDIDLGGNEWIPIGGDYPFVGTFDGKGHTIRNLSASQNALSSEPDRGVALFGYVENTTIKNLRIENCSLQGRYAVSAVAGDGCAPLRFENIEVASGAIRANQNAGERLGQVAGGILGQGWGSAGSSIVFVNCVNRADVLVNKWHAGGIWGSVTVSGGEQTQVELENCRNFGAIEALSQTEGYAGGLGAYASVSSCAIAGCENSGSVTASKYQSDFVAWCNGGPLDGNTK